MQFLSKKQIIILIITLINVIVFSTATYFLVFKSEADDTTPIDVPEPPIVETPDDANHAVQRDALSSLLPDFEWQQVMGGSEDDTVRQVFNMDKFYILGETTSKNFDFKRETTDTELFFAVIQKNGRVMSTATFGTEQNDKFIRAIPTPNFIAVLSQSEANNGDFAVTLINYNGSVYKQKLFDSANEETAMHIAFYNNYIIAVAENKTSSGKVEVRVLFLDEELNVIYERTPIRSASLKFVALLPCDQLSVVLVVNVYEGLTSFCAIYKIRPDQTPAPYEPLKTLAHLALDAIPYHSGGYLVVYHSTDVQSAFIMFVNQKLNGVAHMSLKTAGVESGKIIRGLDIYYVFAGKEDSSQIIAISSDLVNLWHLENGLDSVVSFFNSSVSTVVLGSLGTNTRLIALQNQNIVYDKTTVISSTDEPISICQSADSVVIFANIKTAADVSGGFGKSDIFCAKLRL